MMQPVLRHLHLEEVSRKKAGIAGRGVAMSTASMKSERGAAVIYHNCGQAGRYKNTNGSICPYFAALLLLLLLQYRLCLIIIASVHSPTTNRYSRAACVTDDAAFHKQPIGSLHCLELYQIYYSKTCYRQSLPSTGTTEGIL